MTQEPSLMITLHCSPHAANLNELGLTHSANTNYHLTLKTQAAAVTFILTYTDNVSVHCLIGQSTDVKSYLG